MNTLKNSYKMCNFTLTVFSVVAMLSAGSAYFILLYCYYALSNSLK